MSKKEIPFMLDNSFLYNSAERFLEAIASSIYFKLAKPYAAWISFTLALEPSSVISVSDS